ncbi:MAG: diaminopimelate epimerase [Candidatus Zixiibacteriota bacterium]
MDSVRERNRALAIKGITFTKCESLRNDFVVVEKKRGFPWMPSRVRALCDRRAGVGADGLIVLHPHRGGYDFVLFNADGTRAEWSGNGIRCAAAYTAVQRRRSSATFHTAAGPIDTTMSVSTRGVSVAFERPNPIIGSVRGQRRTVTLSGMTRPIAVDAGNPHWVFIVDHFRFDWEGAGAACQKAAPRTHGVNVEFVRVLNRKRIELRLFERGVGPTPSSGSGALAAFRACLHEELVAHSIQVISPGGAQSLLYRPVHDAVRMSARARLVHQGQWFIR